MQTANVCAARSQEELMEDVIKLNRAQDCAVITLNRPDVHNAFDDALLASFERTLDSLIPGNFRALVITGAGEQAFSVGADIGGVQHRSPDEARAAMLAGQRLFQRVEDMPLVSIAAINGYALGGGLELALACTFRVAHASARLACPEIKLGLVPGYGGTQRLPRLVGLAVAQELLLTGRTLTAAEALQLGVVNRVDKRPAMTAALELASEFTCHSLPALDLVRRAILCGRDVPLESGMATEAELGAQAYSLADSREGIAAFLEKRQPRFRDS
jgi:enoyl-CoA hydratase